MQKTRWTYAYEAWCLGDEIFIPLFGYQDPIGPKVEDGRKP